MKDFYLKPGDNFIRFSKFGSVIGQVYEIRESSEWNYDNNLIIFSPTVLSTNGVTYDYHECKKICRTFTTKEIEQNEQYNNKLKKEVGL
jgi:hypothetical protein